MILISQNGTDVRNATNAQLLFTTQYAFMKLDTQNSNSFVNIQLTFTQDVPYSAGFTTKTLVVSLPHGYTYIPQTWIMYQNSGAPGGSSGFTYGYEDSVIVANDVADGSYLHIEVDATNVYFYVIKQAVGFVPSNASVNGFVLKFRLYVAVDGVGI